MISQRSTHYLLWFLFFGVVTGLVYIVDQTKPTNVPKTEPIWLFVIGLLGIIASAGKPESRYTRPYDLFVGVLFSAAGIFGLLYNLGIHLTGSPIIAGDALLGLSLSLPFTLIHTALGLMSLNQSFKMPPVAANPPSREIG